MCQTLLPILDYIVIQVFIYSIHLICITYRAPIRREESLRFRETKVAARYFYKISCLKLNVDADCTLAVTGGAVAFDASVLADT